jgi:hypothetical protein
MINNQVYSFIRPFFVSRWGWALSTTEMLESYINISCQDVWNYYQWSFKIKTETIETSSVNWEYLKWETTYPIESIIDIYDDEWNQIIPMSGKVKNYTECNVWDNFILTTTDIKSIEIRYYKQYEWISLANDGTKALQFPNRFVPPIVNKIYDLASPLSYFEDDNVVPRYQIAVRQLDELKKADWISADIYFSPDKSI